MSVDNPNWFDRFMMTLESPLARRVMYRPFVDRMGLRGHEKVLDFGSGWGDVTRCMSPRLTDGGSITLMEPSAAWVETSKKRLREQKGLTFVNADILHAGFAPESFDVVVIHYVLHHVPMDVRKATVAEIARALKPGGFVYINEPMSRKLGTMPDQVIDIMVGAGLTLERDRSRRRFFEGKFVKAAEGRAA